MKEKTALISRSMDFWMLGGASIVFWLVYHVFEPFQQMIPVNNIFVQTGFAISVLAMFINYPHFMYTYRLAYGEGPQQIKKYWFQMIFVPLLLVVLFLMAFGSMNSSPPSSYNKWLTNIFSFFNLNGSPVYSKSLGKEMISLLINFMFLTVGWHYTKQIYGCMMVYARYDHYPLNRTQSRWLKSNILLIWLVMFIWIHSFNLTDSTNSYSQSTHPVLMGVDYLSIGFPTWISTMSQLVLYFHLGLVLYFVFWKNYRLGHKPSINFLVPLLSIYIWWIPYLSTSIFTAKWVPFFHCLQYITFAIAVEKEKNKNYSETKKNIFYSLVVLGLISAGAISFEIFPKFLDINFRHGPLSPMGFMFFGVAAHIFLNIHHYFLDNVLWRFNNKNIKKYLFLH